MRRVQIILLVLLVLLVLLMLYFPPFGGSEPEDFEITNIQPPQPTKRIPAMIDPERLPEGARARFPAYDGDSLLVTLPVTERDQMTADEVAEAVVGPILAAIGFERGVQALRTPPEPGVPMARADFDGLMIPVLEEARNNPQATGPNTERLLAVLSGEAQADNEINAALETGVGMNFADFVADIERQEILFPFTQVHEGTPIEHTSITASRWDGQGITSVYGSVLNTYSVANSVVISKEQIPERGTAALIEFEGFRCLTPEVVARYGLQSTGPLSTATPPDDAAEAPGCALVEAGPVLILLPYGSDADGVIQLRYSYRMILRLGYQTTLGLMPAGVQVWIDAENLDVLKLNSLNHKVYASGKGYNRDPGIGTSIHRFEVNSASDDEYVLTLDDMIDGVFFAADRDHPANVSIPAMGGGSTRSFANFNQAPFNDQDEALCASGSNDAFLQINVYARLHHYTAQARALGVFEPFPGWHEFWAGVGDGDSRCYALNVAGFMLFDACEGYFDPACPDTAGPDRTDEFLHFAQDNTVIAHEHAHSLTPSFTNARPDDWCGRWDCHLPIGWGQFHDLADFWAAHFESTNCVGGWVAKNHGGVNNSLYCASSDEGDGLPRELVVETPLNAKDPLDHFPEHLDLYGAGGGYRRGYVTMQMPTAMLWQVRLGMRSKARWSGTPQFAARFARALKRTGFYSIEPGNTDLGLYTYLNDLAEKMTAEWAGAGRGHGPLDLRLNPSHTINKVTAGFARGGIFLIPPQCLYDSPRIWDSRVCPHEQSGADAVIDIDDNDRDDDFEVNGVLHPESDYLELGGPPPTFHVWTGPRYRFDAAGNAFYPKPSPCNSDFRVMLWTDPDLSTATRIISPWQSVDRDPTTDDPECYGTWTPSDEDWDFMQAGGALTRIYYRAETGDPALGSKRVSTEPGAGQWGQVPVPFAVITLDGREDY